MEASELISTQSISIPSPNKTPESQSPKSPICDLNHPPPYDPDRTPEEDFTSSLVLSFHNLNLKEKEAEDEKKDLNEEENVKNLNLKEKDPEDEKHDLNEEENVKSEGEGDDEGSNEENEDEIETEGDDDGGEGVAKDEGSCGADDNGSREYQYPVRPESEDCPYYMRTGTCKFGLNCKFNHPVGRKIQKSVKERTKEREEITQRPIQTECKYYLSTGGCKFGNACRYNHTSAKTLVVPIVELNFLGLPIRLGEKECPYYMRNGSCKYGVNCRFNHPDPTTVGGVDSHPGYGNGGSVSLQSASQSVVAPWSSPRTLNETAPAPFVPMMFSPSQGFPSQNSEWNGYQAPVYPPERSIHPLPAYAMNNVASGTNVYTHRQQQMVLDEFPERPGQPECSYYLKTGDCKYKSNCKYHHPKNRISMPPPFTLSDKGLPLRPDQNICTHYSRYGICKFGPACKFDHPAHPATSGVSGMDQPSPFSNSAMTEGARMAGIGNGSQPVAPSWLAPL